MQETASEAEIPLGVVEADTLDDLPECGLVVRELAVSARIVLDFCALLSISVDRQGRPLRQLRYLAT